VRQAEGELIKRLVQTSHHAFKIQAVSHVAAAIV
jgi:hypothetical protein